MGSDSLPLGSLRLSGGTSFSKREPHSPPSNLLSVSESRFRFLEITGSVRRPNAPVIEEEPKVEPVARVSFRVAETIGGFGAELG